MPSKYQQSMALAEETARAITSDTGRYTDFLTTAAHNFKYGFREQLSITIRTSSPTTSDFGRRMEKAKKPPSAPKPPSVS